MADEMTPEQGAEWVKELMESYLKRASEVHFKPFVQLIGESMARAFKLIEAARQADKETSQEILRAVVVLNHAYLEDFLRSVALWLLPLASEETLNKIPLAGVSGRSEKFQLGKLAEHRGKKVDEVIRESVTAYLERSTFNNVTEIISFLDSVDVKLPREDDQIKPHELPRLRIGETTLSLLGEMMNRRHHIVHRADKVKGSDALQEIAESDVASWLVGTLSFTLSVATENFAQRHSQEEFRKAVEELAKRGRLRLPVRDEGA